MRTRTLSHNYEIAFSRQVSAILFALSLLGVGTACARDETAQHGPTRPIVIRLSTGPEGGGFFPLGEEIATSLRGRIENVDIRTIPSTGGVANIQAVQRGEADMGLTFADIAYMGFSGQLGRDGVPMDRLRGIAVLQLSPISLAARAGAPISSPADLRGKIVSVGPPGSATALTANLILHAFGLDPPVVRIESLGFQEASTRLLMGTVDAMFDNAVIQADSVKRAMQGGARLIPIVGPSVDALRREYPFLKLTLIPPDMYPNGRGSVRTIGVDSLLICRKDMDEGLVYEVTKQFFDALASGPERPSLGFVELDQAPATSIPLHDGAARYYRERELQR
jgi:TRAP transporter TAXI family solute receptor